MAVKKTKIQDDTNISDMSDIVLDLNLEVPTESIDQNDLDISITDIDMPATTEDSQNLNFELDLGELEKTVDGEQVAGEDGSIDINIEDVAKNTNESQDIPQISFDLEENSQQETTDSEQATDNSLQTAGSSWKGEEGGSTEMNVDSTEVASEIMEINLGNIEETGSSEQATDVGNDWIGPQMADDRQQATDSSWKIEESVSTEMNIDSSEVATKQAPISFDLETIDSEQATGNSYQETAGVDVSSIDINVDAVATGAEINLDSLDIESTQTAPAEFNLDSLNQEEVPTSSSLNLEEIEQTVAPVEKTSSIQIDSLLEDTDNKVNTTISEQMLQQTVENRQQDTVSSGQTAEGSKKKAGGQKFKTFLLLLLVLGWAGYVGYVTNPLLVEELLNSQQANLSALFWGTEQATDDRWQATGNRTQLADDRQQAAADSWQEAVNNVEAKNDSTTTTTDEAIKTEDSSTDTTVAQDPSERLDAVWANIKALYAQAKESDNKVAMKSLLTINKLILSIKKKVAKEWSLWEKDVENIDKIEASLEKITTSLNAN